MSERAYFDWNATAPLRPEARAAVLHALESGGNASSVHAEGRQARKLVEQAREQMARLVGAAAQNVIFTSGATEANGLALTPALEVAGRKTARDRLFVSAIEHPSVLAGGRFDADAVETLPVTGDGVVDLEALAKALTRAERPLVSVMLANNETGVIQPVAAIADIVHAANGLLHVDAVQGAGRIDCDMAALGADLMSLSSHKLGGPQGVGALVCRSDIHIAAPMIVGGGQERRLRAGTENVAGIAGFGAACVAANAARQADAARMAALRDRFEAELKAITPRAVVFGAAAARLPNTSLFAAPGLNAETAIISFDLNGIAVSSGSACSSGKVQMSSVLVAMAVAPELARGAVRVSLGWTTSEADLELLLNAWKRVASSLLKRRADAA
ncbi:MAG: aminotransferase class V-fold PLP-dependent enzyme [Rhodopseudomonas sp.]|nr:aminotransferase class V-fold PLP-dependent enzyme [Rhodopseudomonas sp.]